MQESESPQRPARPHRLPTGVRRLVVVLGCFIVLHYLLLPQLAGAEQSLSVLANLNPLLVVVAVAAEAVSLAAYAQFARTLLPAGDRPGFAAILRVQLATLGMSHVVPGGGTAAMPLGFRLLRRAGVATSDATFVVSVQPIGSAAVLNVILLTALMVSIPLRGANPAYVVTAVVGTLIPGGFAVVVIAIGRGSRRADRWVRLVAGKMPYVDADAVSVFLRDLVERFRVVSHDRRLMARAAGWAALQWLADAASLWLFLAALGVTMPPEGLLIAFGLANVSASIPLTPGGLGVYEAVLTSSLVGFGVPHAEAIIGVLAYRLFEFWLPIPVGAAAYVSARFSDPVDSSIAIEPVEAAYVSTTLAAERPAAWARRRGLTGRQPPSDSTKEDPST